MKKPKTLPKRANTKPKLRPMAQAIQAAMRQRGMDVPALTEALGLKVSQRGAVANWVVGVNGVGPQLRPRVAKVLGLNEDQLLGPVIDSLGRRRNPGRPSTAKLLGPAQRAVALVQTAAVNGELLPAAPPVSDVFTIRARTDGTMLIRLDANLPFAKGTQLVQFLLNFGLVIGAEEPS
jgi:hypothetical protein